MAHSIKSMLSDGDHKKIAAECVAEVAKEMGWDPAYAQSWLILKGFQKLAAEQKKRAEYKKEERAAKKSKK